MQYFDVLIIKKNYVYSIFGVKKYITLIIKITMPNVTILLFLKLGGFVYGFWGEKYITLIKTIKVINNDISVF